MTATGDGCRSLRVVNSIAFRLWDGVRVVLKGRGSPQKSVFFGTFSEGGGPPKKSFFYIRGGVPPPKKKNPFFGIRGGGGAPPP